MQIGSNDGKTEVPFYSLLQINKEWQALFLEPIPVFFEKLRANYPDTSRFRFERAAINEGETMSFHWLDLAMFRAFPDLPYWYEQLGSFDRSHIVKRVDPKVLPYFRSEPVKGLRLAILLERHQIAHIDILHIDAEGYDWKILSQLELSRYRPVFILYEYHHLSPEELTSAVAFLEEYYEHFYVGIDTFAVRKDLGGPLIRRMSVQLQAGK